MEGHLHGKLRWKEGSGQEPVRRYEGAGQEHRNLSPNPGLSDLSYTPFLFLVFVFIPF